MKLLRPFEDLAGDADVVFVGRVMSQDIAWGSKGKMIFTHVNFMVEEVIHDRSGSSISEGQELILPFAGGEIDGQGIRVSDVPTFEDDETYVIFARLDGKRYASSTVGGFQGVFRVVVDEQDGVRYPLTSSGRAVVSVYQGRLKMAPAPEGIRSGVMKQRQVIWQERRLGAVPRPAMDMGPARASVADVQQEVPEKIMTLGEFIQFIREIRQPVDAAGGEVTP